MGSSRLRLMVVAGLLSLGVWGCGPTLYHPTFKLTKGGEPVKISEKAMPLILLVAESGTSSYAVSKQGDQLKATGGVPAGKYRMSIIIKDPYPEGKDIFEGKFTGNNGPEVEVKGNSEIVVDLGK